MQQLSQMFANMGVVLNNLRNARVIRQYHCTCNADWLVYWVGLLGLPMLSIQVCLNNAMDEDHGSNGQGSTCCSGSDADDANCVSIISQELQRILQQAA